MPSKVHRRIFELTRKINFGRIYNLDDLVLTGLVRAQTPFKLTNYGDFMVYFDNNRGQLDTKLYAHYKYGKYQDPDGQWRRKRRDNFEIQEV